MSQSQYQPQSQSQSQPQPQTNWEADKMLDVYIYDYLMKRKLHATARAFQAEAKMSTDPVAIDAPGGFLLEWWTVFWDIFSARTNFEHSEAAASYLETQMVKAQEVQQQQQPEFVQNQQMQMQQMLLQRQAQQQQQIRDSMDVAMKYQGVDQLQLQRMVQSQLEQQLIHQAQQSIQSQSVNELERMKLRMLHQNSPLLLRDIDQLIKLQKQQKQLQNSQQQEQYLQHLFANPQSQGSTQYLQQQDKIIGSSMTMDGSMSNTFQVNDQASKSPIVRKRKQHVMSYSTPANTTSADVGKGAFSEIRRIQASTDKIESCHFSSDGKLLATGGHDKKATLWCTESFTPKSILEEHSQWITDVRFCPTISQLATSSADKTVRVWDAYNAGYSLRTFMGHSTTVTSVDFHPGKEDLICSCDNSSEIRYWSIHKGSCIGVFKGGATQTRFQPWHGRMLAAAAENVVSMLDVETQVCTLKLQGHKNPIHSVCWDPSGEFLASVSDDVVRVWTAVSDKYIHELSCTGNKFRSCVFHPSYSHLLIIGCYQMLELWSVAENKTMTVSAHDKLVSSVAASNVSGLVASASHDNCVKLWK